MIISKRQYYCQFLLTIAIMGVLIFIGAPFANHYFLHIDLVDVICRYALIGEMIIIAIVFLITVIANKGIKNYVSNLILRKSIEINLISIGAYIKSENKTFVELPKIKNKKGRVRIKLRQHRAKLVREMRSQIFRQIVQKLRRHTVVCQGISVQDDGKYASRSRTKPLGGLCAVLP